MKPLSSRAAELVAALERPEASRADILGEVQRAPEPALLPAIVPFLFDRANVAAAARAAVESIVQSATPLELLQLDERVRRVWPYRARTSTLDLTSAAIAGIASVHPSGFERGRAVAWLARSRDTVALSFLLIRANDWVDVVAERAAAAVVDRITPEHAAAFALALPLVVRLADTTRRDNSALARAVLDLLRQPEQRDALAVAQRSSDARARRIAWRLATSSDSRAIGDALRDRDTIVRLDAARTAVESLDDDALRALLPAMRRNRFAPVRRLALEATIERFGADAGAELERAIFDANRSVRELARYHLRQRDPSIDLAARYREALPGSLAALGEVGSSADAALVLPFVDAPDAKTRARAIRVLAKLDLTAAQDAIAARLDDAAIGVSSAARDALIARPGVVGAARLLALARTSEHAHVCANARALIGAMQMWDALPLVLRIDPSVALGWTNAMRLPSIRPTPSQISAALEALDRVERDGALDRENVRELRALLDGWRHA